MSRLYTKRRHLMNTTLNTLNKRGSGLSVGTINIYNPKRKPINEETIKSILDSKSFLVFHITGNIDPIKRLLGSNLHIERSNVNKNLTDGFYWYSMPQYKADDKVYPVIYIGFLNDTDKYDFTKRLGIKISDSSRYVHYPKPIINNNKKIMYKITYKINPKYPIYIISKGRWKKRLTSRACEEAGIPYKIVVEPDEYDNYAEVIDEKKIIKAPMNFSKLKKGSIPVRNFVWSHAVKSGAKKHWILDDNIDGFYRWNLNSRFKIKSGVLFKLIEDYVERFTNIKQAGMNYRMFYPDRQPKHPITFNTRVYSCILIDHDLDKILKERWRGKYNEDTDLSIRILKQGYATALFNAYLCGKEPTLVSSGGNTDTIYSKGSKEALLAKAESLVKQHPDVASVVKRYKRGIHHQVNYGVFKNNELGYKNPKISKSPKEYNMRLVKYHS